MLNGTLLHGCTAPPAAHVTLRRTRALWPSALRPARTCGHAERLREVAGDAEVDRFDRARLGREAGDDDDRQVGLVALRFADDASGRPCPASSGRRSADRRGTSASARAPSGRRGRRRRRTRRAPASSPADRGCSLRRPRRGRAAATRRSRRGPPARAACRRGARRAARPLAVEPGVDVALAEPPLAADADRRDLSGLDQPVDRAQVDLEVLQDFFRGEKRFVNHSHRSRQRPVVERPAVRR